MQSMGNRMSKLEFNNFTQICEYIYNLSEESEQEICVVMFKSDILQLLKKFMEYSDISCEHIDIQDTIRDDYDKEYYLIFYPNCVIDLEPVYQDCQITFACSDIVLLGEDVNSLIAMANDEIKQFEIIINKSECDDCGDCCYDCTQCPKSYTR